MSEKNKDLTYENEDGQTVFTSAYLKKRGTCCKTNCLHCPFGHTLKNFNIEVVELEFKHIKLANEIVRDSMPVQHSQLTSSLLSEAFGAKEQIRIHHISKTNFTNFSFGRFKDTICAVIEYSTKLSESSSGRSINKIFLKKEFQDQGLGVEHIKESK